MIFPSIASGVPSVSISVYVTASALHTFKKRVTLRTLLKNSVYRSKETLSKALISTESSLIQLFGLLFIMPGS